MFAMPGGSGRGFGGSAGVVGGFFGGVTAVLGMSGGSARGVGGFAGVRALPLFLVPGGSACDVGGCAGVLGGFCGGVTGVLGMAVGSARNEKNGRQRQPHEQYSFVSWTASRRRGSGPRRSGVCPSLPARAPLRHTPTPSNEACGSSPLHVLLRQKQGPSGVQRCCPRSLGVALPSRPSSHDSSSSFFSH